MQIYLGQDKLLDMTLGTPQISEVYIGNTRIFPGFYGIQTVNGSRALVESILIKAGSDASASISLISDGSITFGGKVTYTNIQNKWYDKVLAGIGNNYWVRARSISGTPGTGTLNAWLQLSTTRTWARTAAVGTARSWVIELDFATDSSGSNIIGTYNIALEAESTEEPK